MKGLGLLGECARRGKNLLGRVAQKGEVWLRMLELMGLELLRTMADWVQV